MTDSDIKTGKELLNEEYIQKNPLWAKVCVGVGVPRAPYHVVTRPPLHTTQELELMIKTKEKAEIRRQWRARAHNHILPARNSRLSVVPAPPQRR